MTEIVKIKRGAAIWKENWILKEGVLISKSWYWYYVSSEQRADKGQYYGKHFNYVVIIDLNFDWISKTNN